MVGEAQMWVLLRGTSEATGAGRTGLFQLHREALLTVCPKHLCADKHLCPLEKVALQGSLAGCPGRLAHQAASHLPWAGRRHCEWDTDGTVPEGWNSG